MRHEDPATDSVLAALPASGVTTAGSNGLPERASGIVDTSDTWLQEDKIYHRFTGSVAMALLNDELNVSSPSLNGTFSARHSTLPEVGQTNVSTITHEDISDGSGKPWDLLKQPMALVIVLSLAYVVVFVLGVINNSLVVSVIYRNLQLRTVTNYFIANLAVADILVCILVLPITLLNNIFTEWWYGSALCKMAPYLQGVAVSASVNTLAAVAVERYLAIFYPHTQRLSPRTAVIMIICIWLVPMGIFIPWIKVYNLLYYQKDGFIAVLCTAEWSRKETQKMYTLCAVFLTCYLVPLVFIAICYLLIGLRVWNRKVKGIRGSRTERNINRSKIRIVRMLLVVFVIFSIWWLPLYTLQLVTLFGPDMATHEQMYRNIKAYGLPFAQWLGASNSCVNPFIYCYFSTRFRRSIIAALRSGTCCGKITA